MKRKIFETLIFILAIACSWYELIHLSQKTDTIVLSQGQKIRMISVSGPVVIVDGDAHVYVEAAWQFAVSTRSGQTKKVMLSVSPEPGAMMKPYNTRFTLEGYDEVWLTHETADVTIETHRGATIIVPRVISIVDLLIMFLAWFLWIVISIEVVFTHVGSFCTNTRADSLRYAVSWTLTLATVLWWFTLYHSDQLLKKDGYIGITYPTNIQLSQSISLTVTGPHKIIAGSCDPFSVKLSDGTTLESTLQAERVGRCISYHKAASGSLPPGITRVLTGEPTLDIYGTINAKFQTTEDIGLLFWIVLSAFALITLVPGYIVIYWKFKSDNKYKHDI